MSEPTIIEWSVGEVAYVEVRNRYAKPFLFEVVVKRLTSMSVVVKSLAQEPKFLSFPRLGEPIKHKRSARLRLLKQDAPEVLAIQNQEDQTK